MFNILDLLIKFQNQVKNIFNRQILSGIMNLIKTSTVPMVQGFHTGEDLKKIVFSHSGNLVVSIDRTYGVKLWNTTTQFLKRQFNQLIAHHAVFTLDDSMLILIGKDKLHYFDTNSTKEINRIEGGFNMGTGSCSPDNKFFVYTNTSQLYVRQLQTFSLINFTTNSPCQPFFAQFDEHTNKLYTASLNQGIVCKWNTVQLHIQSQNRLNSMVTDLDFSQTFLFVSSDRHQRQVFTLNLKTLKLEFTTTLPKSFFLDFNTQIQSTFNQRNNALFSIAIPGSNVFAFDASNLTLLGKKCINVNTYTLAYNQKIDILALGGQVPNRQLQRIEDQVLFYKIGHNCSSEKLTILNSTTFNKQFYVSEQQTSICLCNLNYFWNIKQNQCQKLQCKQKGYQFQIQLSPFGQSQCRCLLQNQFWNSITQNCQLDCSIVSHSFPSAQAFLNDDEQQCPCLIAYRWNKFKKACEKVNCNEMAGSNGNKIGDKCECIPPFYFDQQLFMCKLDCSKILHTKQNIKTTPLNSPACQCEDNFFWSSQSYTCQFDIKSLDGSGFFFPFWIIGVIVPIILLCLISCGLIIWWRFYKMKKKQDKVASTQTPASIKIKSKNFQIQGNDDLSIPDFMKQQKLDSNPKTSTVSQSTQKNHSKPMINKQNKEISSRRFTIPINSQKKHYNERNLNRCEICFKPKADCITVCGHKFHYKCIFLKEQDEIIECPHCLSFFHNGREDINSL